MNSWSLPNPEERLARLDPFAPHDKSVFEGYYFRIDLPSEAVLAVILLKASPRRAEEMKSQGLSRIASFFQHDQSEDCPCREGPDYRQPPPPPDNHRIMLTYFPGPRSPTLPTHIMVTPSDMQMAKSPNERDMAAGAFSVLMPGIGEMSVGPRPNSLIRLDLSTSEFQLFLETKSRVSWSGKSYGEETRDDDGENRNEGLDRVRKELEKLWSRGKDWLDTPAGWMSMLPGMPLYWHVHSVTSEAVFRLSIPRIYLPTEDRSGSEANVHAQSNWGNAFPTRHIWIHAHKKGIRESDNGIRMEDDQWLMCAGGDIMHTQSFLIGYRGARNDIYFKPPTAVSLREYGKTGDEEPCGLSKYLGKVTQFSPIKLTTNISWEGRTVEIEVKSVREKVRITASAPDQTFVAMATPVEHGRIKPNGVAESMRATVQVRVYRRTGMGGVVGDWELCEEANFHNAALEFGGQYYESEPPEGPAVGTTALLPSQ